MLHDQSLLLGDEEVIGGLKITPVLSLMSMRGVTTDAQIDILNEENADSYWQRSDQFDMGLGRHLDGASAPLPQGLAHESGGEHQDRSSRGAGQRMDYRDLCRGRWILAAASGDDRDGGRLEEGAAQRSADEPRQAVPDEADAILMRSACGGMRPEKSREPPIPTASRSWPVAISPSAWRRLSSCCAN